MNIKPSTYRSVVAICFLTFLFGCQSTQEKAGYIRYNDDRNHFSIALPSDWQVKQNISGVALRGLIPDKQNKPGRDGIVIMTRKFPTGSRNMKLDEFYKSSLELLKGTFREFALGESKNVNIDGVEARMFIARYKLGKHELQGIFYIFVNNSFGYGISCSGSPENFSKNEKMFAKVIKTFRFEEP